MFIPRWIDKERQNPPLRNVKLLDSFVKLSKHFVYHILANLLVNVLRTVFSDHADFLASRHDSRDEDSVGFELGFLDGCFSLSPGLPSFLSPVIVISDLPFSLLLVFLLLMVFLFDQSYISPIL